jgi:predicted PurR-regulated permease PerM
VTDPQSFLAQPNAIEVIQATLQEASAYLGFFGNAALHLFVMILIAFYLLRDDDRLAGWWRRRFSDRNGVMETYATRVDTDFSHIFFGNLLNAFLTGVIGATAYGVLDFFAPQPLAIPYPALLGLLTGVASLVPVVGIKLVYVPLAAYLGFMTIGNPVLLWFPLLFVAVSFVIVDVIPDLVLRPYVSGRNLHLGMVMLAYIFGPLLFGWYGIFLGPMILVLLVHFTSLVLPELLAGTAIQPEVVGESILTGEAVERPSARDPQSTVDEFSGARDSGAGDTAPSPEEPPDSEDRGSPESQGPDESAT